MSEELKPCPYCGETVSQKDVCDDGNFLAVYCPNCSMRGPYAYRPEHDAVAMWNALPRKLRWTREKPTKDGWYWHDQGLGFGIVIEYVDMEIGPTGGVLEDEMWAGPIPEPKD